jgi:hypothetical protein
MNTRIKPTPNPSTPKNGAGTITAPDGSSYKESSPVKDTNDKQYNIKRFMYPEDLENNPEHGQQMVVFFINVSTAGKTIDGKTDQTLYDIPAEDLPKFSGTRVGQKVPDSYDGFVTAAKMKRLDTAIALHMPNSVKTNYGVNWGESTDEEMRGKDFVVQSALKVGESKSFGDGVNNTAKVVKNALQNTAAGTFGKYIQKSARVTQGNSKQEQVFDGVQFRTFDFSYTFFPRSKTEAENILNIIRMLRYHMLPEFLDEMSFMYIYPSEFNIKYYSNGTENQYIEKLSTCVLKSLDVDYTPNGQLNTFAPDAKGAMPTQINVSMQFQELSKPTKETSPWYSQGL